MSIFYFNPYFFLCSNHRAIKSVHQEIDRGQWNFHRNAVVIFVTCILANLIPKRILQSSFSRHLLKRTHSLVLRFGR